MMMMIIGQNCRSGNGESLRPSERERHRRDRPEWICGHWS